MKIKTVYLTYDVPYQTWNIVDRETNTVIFFNRDIDVVDKWLEAHNELKEDTNGTV